jgi:hypothetical protein
MEPGAVSVLLVTTLKIESISEVMNKTITFLYFLYSDPTPAVELLIFYLFNHYYACSLH